MAVTRLVAPAVVVALASCGGPRDCSAVGCPEGARSSVAVEAHGIADVSAGALVVCVDGDCRPAAFPVDAPSASVVLAVPGADDGDPVEATLVMLDGSRYRATGEMADTRPNGAGCPPVCTAATLRLEAA